MQAMSLPPQQELAYSRFGEALHAFSDDPSTINWARYLAASQALDDARAEEGGQPAMAAGSGGPWGNQKGEA